MKEFPIAIAFILLMVGFYIFSNFTFVEAHESTHEQSCILYGGNVTSIETRIFDGKVVCENYDKGLNEIFAYQDTIGYHTRWFMNMLIFLVAFIGTFIILTVKYIFEDTKVYIKKNRED